MISECAHTLVSCVNQFELIRKYRCASCNEVMMCGCEEQFAKRYVRHQIGHGRELETQQEIKVTLGFQRNVCNSCRGLPEEAHPAAAIHGRTSKIARYYWREIAFETIKQFSDWAEGEGFHPGVLALPKHSDVYYAFQKQVIAQIKQQHQRSPKYTYKEASQSEVLARYDVEVVKLDGVYAKSENRLSIVDGARHVTPEEFAANHFQRFGYDCVLTESRPFHCLFAVFMWMLIEDPDDSEVRITGFGRRDALPETPEQVWTSLPSDFGVRGYSRRRADAIEAHLSELPDNKQELLWQFDYWLEPSEPLRHIFGLIGRKTSYAPGKW